MEFGYSRRRDGFYCEKDGDQKDSSSNNPHISIPSTSTFYPSSSSSTTTAVEKEHMFDKVVTPSDVGKLNRLVIPKQHAERCFPFDALANEKGLHLNFEDRTGKPWRFRYSYWNSSQSYVMTKGWSRFVKEKRLNAGDTVSFARDPGNLARMFIDWKRRQDIREPPPLLLHTRSPFSFSPRFLVPNAPVSTLYHQHQQISYGYTNVHSLTVLSGSGQYPVYRSPQMQTLGGMPTVLDSVVGHAASKRVRLFGVNLDFQENAVPLQHGRAESSRIFSSSTSSPSAPASGKEDGLSLELDI